MELPELDARLAALRAAVADLGTKLYDLEELPAHKLADPTAMTGATADRVARAAGELQRAWECFAPLTTAVDRADHLRGTSGRLSHAEHDELERILLTASVTLPAEPGQPPVQRGPDDLVGEMTAAITHAEHEFSALEDVLRAVTPRLDTVRAEADQVADLAADIGEARVPELNQARRTLDEVGALAATDAFSVDGRRLDAAAASVAAAREYLTRQRDRRDGLGSAVDDARRQLDGLRAVIADGIAAGERARSRVGGASSPPAALSLGIVDDAGGLRSRLERIAERDPHDWRQAAAALDAWRTALTEHRAEADRVLAANRAPLDAVDELRGRLDAYQAKAGGAGRGEDPELTALYEQCRTVLFTAPINLGEAETMVSRYGAALTSAAPARSREADQ